VCSAIFFDPSSLPLEGRLPGYDGTDNVHGGEPFAIVGMFIDACFRVVGNAILDDIPAVAKHIAIPISLSTHTIFLFLGWLLV
jgi:hypothetical protein